MIRKRKLVACIEIENSS